MSSDFARLKKYFQVDMFAENDTRSLVRPRGFPLGRRVSRIPNKAITDCEY